MINIDCKWLTLTIAFCALLSAKASVAASFNLQEAKIKDSALQQCLQDLAAAKQWSQPLEFTAIKCHSMNIQSLQGLEQFKNIQLLSIYNNKLEQIDMDLGQLQKLKTLNLARNNLEHLAIAELASLEKLYLFDNRLKSLQLTNLSNLLVLKTNNNVIETFTYSNTPKLKKIYIFNNQLESINIYELPDLQYMDCRQNPMPDKLYDEMDQIDHITFLHDGNAEDW